MNRKGLFSLMTAGDALPAADLTALGMPSIPAAIADYVAAKHVVGPVNKTILTLAALSTAMADNGANASGGTKLLDFAQGAIKFLGATINLSLTTNLGATADIVIGAGTAAAGANGTLTTTEQNVIPSTAITFSSSAATATAQSATTITALTDNTGASAGDTIANFAGTNTSELLAETEAAVASLAAKINSLIAALGGSQLLTVDGTGSAVAIYLNYADANDTGGTGKYVAATGTITIFWANLGDY